MLLNGHFQLEKSVLADWVKTKKVSTRSGMRIAIVVIYALDKSAKLNSVACRNSQITR